MPKGLFARGHSTFDRDVDKLLKEMKRPRPNQGSSPSGPKNDETRGHNSAEQCRLSLRERICNYRNSFRGAKGDNER